MRPSSRRTPSRKRSSSISGTRTPLGQRRRMVPGPALAVGRAVGLATVLALTGCVGTAPAQQDASGTSATPEPSSPVAPSGIVPLGAGFLGGNTTPTPEATITPEAGSWADVAPPSGYRVALIADGSGSDPAARTLTAAVEAWAGREGVDLQVLPAADNNEVEARLDEAVAVEPDLVLGAGAGVVDVFSLLTAQNLAQPFLILGAELPEPTGNVVSVTWPGATFRGTGISDTDGLDAATTTARQADDAVTAGVAAMLHGLSGIVISIRLVS